MVSFPTKDRDDRVPGCDELASDRSEFGAASNVLLDTEFTSLEYPKLISLGLVTADGYRSYGNPP